MADPTLILGLAGIGGTVAVAFLGNGTTAVLQLRGEKNQKEQEEEARRRVSRQAARLVELELRNTNSALEACLGTSSWWPAKDPPLTEAWRVHQALLAADLEDGWPDVASAYSGVESLLAWRAAVEMVMENEGPSGTELPFDDETAEVFKKYKGWIEEGIAALQTFEASQSPLAVADKDVERSK